MELHWHTEPLLLLSILGWGWLYALLVGPYRERIAPTGTPFPLRHALNFYGALAVIYLTVGSPLDQIGEQFLFSAHMFQHMLLVYVIPFMVFWGLPVWLVDRPMQHSGVRKTMRFLTHPAIGGAAFTLVYTLWHVPMAYEAALQNKAIHIFEHATVFISAMMMLWCFASPSRLAPAAPYGVRMLTIFLLMIAQLPVFAFLTFSDSPHYPTYEFAPRIIPDLDPLADQILGGVIMKVANMAVSIVIFALAFYLWARKETSTDRNETYYVSSSPAPSP